MAVAVADGGTSSKGCTADACNGEVVGVVVEAELSRRVRVCRGKVCLGDAVELGEFVGESGNASITLIGDIGEQHLEVETK
jgi:hypothetical protein